MNPFDILREVVSTTSPPMLEFVDYEQAHLNFNWKVVRDTLTRMQFTPHEASRLAGIHTGCPRVRLERLIADKHVLV